MEEMRNTYKILVGKPEGKRPLGGPRRRWYSNIKMDHREREWEGVDWIHLAEDRNQWQTLASMVINFRLLLKAGNFLTSRVNISFSRMTLLHGVS
jgi:hypothetical protein